MDLHIPPNHFYRLRIKNTEKILCFGIIQDKQKEAKPMPVAVRSKA